MQKITFLWKLISVVSVIIALCPSGGESQPPGGQQIISQIYLEPNCTELEPPPCNLSFSTNAKTGAINFEYYLETCGSHQCVTINPSAAPPPPVRRRRPPPPPIRRFRDTKENGRMDPEHQYFNHPYSYSAYGNGTYGPAHASPPPPHRVQQPLSNQGNNARARSRFPHAHHSDRPTAQNTITDSRAPYFTIGAYGGFIRPSYDWFCTSNRVGYRARVEAGTGMDPGQKEDQWAQCHYQRFISLVGLGIDTQITRYGGDVCIAAYKSYICAAAFPKCSPAAGGLAPTGTSDVYGPDTLNSALQANVTFVINKPCRTLCFAMIRMCPVALQIACHLKESRDWGDYPGCNVAGNPAGGNLYV